MMKTTPSRIRASAFFLIALAAFFTSACGPSSSSSSASSSDSREKPEIALIMKSLANEFFGTMAKGARAHHEKHTEEYALIVNGIKNETDLGQQVNLVEQMVARGVDAIVIAPADSKALVPVLRRAERAGVLVVNIDNRLDAGAMREAGLTAPFVGPDNRAGARLVGETLARNLQPGSDVAIIEGVPTAYNGQQRRLGFEEAMQAAEMNIVSVQAGNWELSRANTIASAMLNRFPELAAILAANDSMALGAVAAVEAANREEVLIVGFDNISAIGHMLEDGRVHATADQHADKLAVYGIETALGILAGEVPPEDRTTSVDVITRETR